MKIPAIGFLMIAVVIPVYSQGACYCGFDFVGNVRNQEGRRISNAIVTLSGCADLQCRDWRVSKTRTNTFGYFTFRDVLPIDYVIEIKAKAYRPYAAIVPMYDVEANNVFILLRTNRDSSAFLFNFHD